MLTYFPPSLISAKEGEGIFYMRMKIHAFVCAKVFFYRDKRMLVMP